MTVLSKRFRSWLFWTVVVFGMVGLSFAVDSAVLSFSTYSLLLVFAVSYLMARAAADSVEVTRQLDRDEAHIGDRVHVVLTISNARPWPVPWVFVDEHVPERIPIEGTKSKVMFLLPGQKIMFDYQAVFNRRGYHRFGPAIIETGDLFGLHRRYRTSRTADYVTVLPDVLPIGQYEIGSRRPIGPVRFAHRIFEDPTRIAGVREYRPGDSLARIHWKASARTGALYSKVYEPSTVIGATVVLDFHETGYRRDDGTASDDRGDMAVTVAASIATFIAENGEQIGLFTNGRDAAKIARRDRDSAEMNTRVAAIDEVDSGDVSWRLWPVNIKAVRGVEQARTIVETLARVTYTDGLTLANSLARFHGMIVRNSALLIVTTRVTPELALVLVEMKRVGFAVTVFIVMDSSAYADAQGLLLPQNIDVIHIKSEESLREVATGNVYC